jgi:hypothetical protein
MACLFLLGSSHLNVFADDAALEAVGGNLSPMKGHPAIRMVGEEVHIKLPDGKVEARFVFKNEGPATTITIGFPEQGKDTMPRRPSHLVSFKSWVDGKLVSTKQVFTEKPEDGGNDYYYKSWWIKKVPFAKGQTLTIEPISKVRFGSPNLCLGLCLCWLNFVSCRMLRCLMSYRASKWPL